MVSDVGLDFNPNALCHGIFLFLSDHRDMYRAGGRHTLQVRAAKHVQVG